MAVPARLVAQLADVYLENGDLLRSQWFAAGTLDSFVELAREREATEHVPLYVGRGQREPARTKRRCHHIPNFTACPRIWIP